jgi:hypothetical protein
MQEAMLSCVDIYKPKYVLSADLGILNFAATVPTGTMYSVTPQQMSVRRIPMTWFCEMANLVIGTNGELLEYCHLIAHHTTLLNSIISTPNAKFMTMDIKDF